MRVLVCGKSTLGQVDRKTIPGTDDLRQLLETASYVRRKVSICLEELHQGRNFELLVTPASSSLDRLAKNWARAKKIETLTFSSKIFLSMREATDTFCERIFTESRPDLVINFAGGDEINYLINLANRLKLEVISYDENFERRSPE